MFKDLTILRKSRSGLEAFGFYLAYFGLGLLICGLLGGVASLFYPSGSFKRGMEIGNLVSIFYCLLLSVLIIRAKKSYTFMSFVLIILSGCVALFLALTGGLIPVAILTTFRQGNKSAKLV
jgi:hypothetical protein